MHNATSGSNAAAGTPATAGGAGQQAAGSNTAAAGLNTAAAGLSAAMGERRIREILDAAPDAILQVDQQGRIILLNRATEKMFGYDRTDLLGQPVEILIPEEVRPRHHGHRAGYENHASIRPMGIGMQLEGLRRDGSRFPVEISLSPSESPEMGFTTTAIIRDITERKLVEARFSAAQEKYTGDLIEANQQLEVQNREIERANRLKSEFLASMSHELRTPLHTIIGFSELLGEELHGFLTEKQKRFVGHIHTDSLHLLDLINDILDLSKIEAGRLELRPEPFDFAALVAESMASVRTVTRAKSLGTEANIQVDGAVEADRVRVKQILVNLLSNAAKFTPHSGHIRVDAKTVDGFLVTSVTDTGVGIAPEEHEAIFDQFYQTGVTTRGVREGTGLGLAITRRLVHGHGGTINVESTPGKGSFFTFTVPMRPRRDA